MYQVQRFLFVVTSLLMITFQLKASHIMGGQFEMLQIGVVGNYKINLKLYYDDINAGTTTPKATYKVGIYRKSDNSLMTSFLVSYKSKVPLTYINQTCATQKSLKTSEVIYSYDAYLDPLLYTQQKGYYIISEVCCRNPDIDNIQNAGSVGNAFYLEFPPLTIQNSSPIFDTPSGEYICRNDPFRYSFRAVDNDGDLLEYSLVTPLAGTANFFTSEKISPGPNYPKVSWINGYSETNAIPGAPSLSISQRGLLTVTANGLVNQLYVFCVEVKEFRIIGGIKTQIGLVRRDFQLFVIDCPLATSPNPSVTLNNNPASSTLSICGGQSIELKADNNTGWSYQWEKDDEDINGATTASLIVSTPGTYKLYTSLKNACSKSTSIQTFTVSNGGSPFDIIVSGGKNNGFCEGKSVELSGNVSGTNYTFQWEKDGIILPNTSDKLNVTEAGIYKLTTNNSTNTCLSVSNTKMLQKYSLPDATITASSNEICPSEKVNLEASKYINGTYQWRLDGTILSNYNTEKLQSSNTGEFSLKITDQNNCESDIKKITITAITPITPAIITVPTVCDINSSLTIKATPAGGIFSGTGINTTGVFTPKVAGVGVHTIFYTITGNTHTCLNGIATNTITVASPPIAPNLSSTLVVPSGTSITLDGRSSDATSYQWTPSLGLTNPTDGLTRAIITNDITYDLVLKNSSGCEAKYQVHITTEGRVLAPNAFTPNNDGFNDTWEISGLSTYPNAEIFIYDRWGHPVFYSKGYAQPFEGKSENGTALSSGIYPYKISLTPEKTPLFGSVSILR